MENLIQKARHSMRIAYDNAAAHRQFATMFISADMPKLANYHLERAKAQSRMAILYEEIMFSLMSEN